MGKKYIKEINAKEFKVTIFGSARIKRDTWEYKEIYSLGKFLGEKGIDLVTGGGPGAMEAASKGHKHGKTSKKQKAHTIGLAIKLTKEQKINKGVGVVKEFKHFSERLDNFMLLSNVIIVTYGGIGTLLELLYSWQLVQVKQICNIPIILVGKQWPELIIWMEKYMLKKGYVNPIDMNLVFLAKDNKEAVRMINKAYEEYKKGTKNYCLNYKKYKLY